LNAINGSGPCWMVDPSRERSFGAGGSGASRSQPRPPIASKSSIAGLAPILQDGQGNGSPMPLSNSPKALEAIADDLTRLVLEVSAGGPDQGTAGRAFPRFTGAAWLRRQSPARLSASSGWIRPGPRPRPTGRAGRLRGIPLTLNAKQCVLVAGEIQYPFVYSNPYANTQGLGTHAFNAPSGIRPKPLPFPIQRPKAEPSPGRGFFCHGAWPSAEAPCFWRSHCLACWPATKVPWDQKPSQQSVWPLGRYTDQDLLTACSDMSGATPM